MCLRCCSRGVCVSVKMVVHRNHTSTRSQRMWQESLKSIKTRTQIPHFSTLSQNFWTELSTQILVLMCYFVLPIVLIAQKKVAWRITELIALNMTLIFKLNIIMVPCTFISTQVDRSHSEEVQYTFNWQTTFLWSRFFGEPQPVLPVIVFFFFFGGWGGG